MKNNVPFLFFESSAAHRGHGKRTALVNSPRSQGTASGAQVGQAGLLTVGRYPRSFGRRTPEISARPRKVAPSRASRRMVLVDPPRASCARNAVSTATQAAVPANMAICFAYRFIPPICPRHRRPQPRRSRFPKVFSATPHPTAGLNRERSDATNVSGFAAVNAPAWFDGPRPTRLGARKTSELSRAGRRVECEASCRPFWPRWGLDWSLVSFRRQLPLARPIRFAYMTVTATIAASAPWRSAWRRHRGPAEHAGPMRPLQGEDVPPSTTSRLLGCGPGRNTGTKSTIESRPNRRELECERSYWRQSR